MRGKIIMIENRKIEDEEREQVEKKLKKDKSGKRRTVSISKDYPDGHIKSLRFKGSMQIRG